MPPGAAERQAIETQMADLDRQQEEAEALPKNSKERRQRLSRIEANRTMYRKQLDALAPQSQGAPPLDHDAHAAWREAQ
jgi:hypothetical protein